MRRFIYVILCLVLATAAFATDQIPAPSPVQNPVVEAEAKISTGAILEQAVARLKRIEQLIYPELTRGMTADVSNLFIEAYTLLELLPQDIDVSVRKEEEPATATLVDPNQGAIPPSRFVDRLRPVPERYPIMTEEFNALLIAVQAEPYRRNKQLLISTASQSFVYSVDQIIRILDSMSFAVDKLQALEILYPGCTDPQNRYRILDSFSLMADKTRAAELMQP